MGIEMGKIRVDGRGRITLPCEIRDAVGLAPGMEVTVQKTEKGILVRPGISKEDFIKGLKSCITKKNQAAPVNPLKLKKIWGVRHAHD